MKELIWKRPNDDYLSATIRIFYSLVNTNTILYTKSFHRLFRLCTINQRQNTIPSETSVHTLREKIVIGIIVIKIIIFYQNNREIVPLLHLWWSQSNRKRKMNTECYIVCRKKDREKAKWVRLHK